MRKLYRYIFSMFLCILIGCTHGLIGSLPHIDSNAAELIVIRDHAFTGSGVSYKVTLDDQDVLAIRVGEYAKLPVAAGVHKIGVGKFMSYNVRFEPCKKYYFVIKTSFYGVVIEPLSEEKGLDLISKSKYLPLENK